MRLATILVLGLAFVVIGCRKPIASQSTPAPQTNAPAQAQAASKIDAPQPSNSGGVQGSAGVVQNVRQAAKRVVDGNDLSNFAKAYIQYSLTNGSGPTKIGDLKDSLTPKMVEAYQDGAYGVNWKIRDPNSNTVLAYVKDPDVYGTRLAAKGDGSVTRMSKEEFEKANSGK